MIWHWFKNLLAAMWWFFSTPDARQIARVDENAKCPLCGERRGRLRCVEVPVDSKESSGIVAKTMCQHTCLVCGARWFENPVAAVNSALIWPAIARNESEKAEDDQLLKRVSTPRTVAVIGTKSAERKDVN